MKGGLAFQIDGLPVAVRGPLEEDSLRRALAPSLGAYLEVPPSEHPAAITITWRVDSEGDLSAPHLAREPSFVQGAIDVGVMDDGFLIVAVESYCTVVRRDGRSYIDLTTRDLTADYARRFVVHFALLLALREHRRFHLHAALVEVPDGSGWLVAGPSGSGKTTTTLVLAVAGLRPLADDSVLLTPRRAALPVARPFHVFPAMLEPLRVGLERRLGEDLVTEARFGAAGKLDMKLAHPRRDALSLSAVILLSSPSTHTVIRRPEQAFALGRLMEESAVLAMAGMPHRIEQLAALRALVEDLPVLDVSVGPDALATPRALRDAIERELRAIAGVHSARRSAE